MVGKVVTPDPSGAARAPQTTDELVAEVKAALESAAHPAYGQRWGQAKADIRSRAEEWLGALVQAVEDLREKLGRANEQNQYCHDNHSTGQQMVIESQTQQLHDIRLEVAQLRADGQRLRERFQEVANRCRNRLIWLDKQTKAVRETCHDCDITITNVLEIAEAMAAPPGDAP